MELDAIVTYQDPANSLGNILVTAAVPGLRNLFGRIGQHHGLDLGSTGDHFSGGAGAGLFQLELPAHGLGREPGRGQRQRCRPVPAEVSGGQPVPDIRDRLRDSVTAGVGTVAGADIEGQAIPAFGLVIALLRQLLRFNRYSGRRVLV